MFHFAKPALLSLAVIAGFSSLAEAQYRFQSGAWRGGAYFSQGRFSHCAMQARYRSGIILLFSITRSYKFLLGFARPGWNLRPNGRYRMRYAIDRYVLFDGIARVSPPNMIVATIPATRRIFDRFRRGRVFYVINDQGTNRFSLAGTNRALTRLLRCTHAHVRSGR